MYLVRRVLTELTDDNILTLSFSHSPCLDPDDDAGHDNHKAAAARPIITCLYGKLRWRTWHFDAV